MMIDVGTAPVLRQADIGNIKPMLRLVILTVSALTVLSDKPIYVPDLPTKNYRLEGDLNLGVLMSVHQRDLEDFCDDQVRDLDEIQRMESLVYFIGQVNADDTLLPDHSLGFVILDDCYNDLTALAQSLHFSRTYPPDSCAGGVKRCANNASITLYDTVGVLAAESSITTVWAANLLTSYQLPQLSFLATTPLLSDRYRYPRFQRVVPSDDLQVKAIVDLLVYYNWTFVSVVYSEGEYGGSAYEALVQAMADVPGDILCLAEVHEVRRSFTQSDYNNLVYALLYEKKSRVVVAFVPDFESLKLMNASRLMESNGRLTWIAADAWARDLSHLTGFEDEIKGGFSFNIRSSNVPEFDDYFSRLRGEHAEKNPWLSEFCEAFLNCSYADKTGYASCGAEVGLTQPASYRPATTVSLIRDAIYTFAHALHTMVTSSCRDVSGDALTQCAYAHLSPILMDVSFQGYTGDLVAFDAEGNRVLPYDVYNVQNQSDGTYVMTHVAYWLPETGVLEFLTEEVTWANGTKPDARCSAPCDVGEEDDVQQKTCCWGCRECDDDEKTIEVNGRRRCYTCEEGTWPDPETRSECEKMVPRHINWDSPIGIAITAITFLGVLITIPTLVFFIWKRRHPLMKASSRELSFFMLFGITASFAFAFCFVTMPTVAVCAARMTGVALCPTVMYAPLMARSVRIFRIFASGKKMIRKPRFVNMKSQIFLVLGVCSVHVLVVLIWLRFDPPSTHTVMGSPGQLDLLCHFPYAPFLTSISYNMAILIVCTVFAVLNRKLPDNFNESRFIGICVYSAVILWVAFVPAYYTTLSVLGSLFLSLMLILNALVALGCLYMPKIYAVYFVRRDELRIRESTTQGPASHVGHFLGASMGENRISGKASKGGGVRASRSPTRHQLKAGTAYATATSGQLGRRGPNGKVIDTAGKGKGKLNRNSRVKGHNGTQPDILPSIAPHSKVHPSGSGEKRHSGVSGSGANGHPERSRRHVARRTATVTPLNHPTDSPRPGSHAALPPSGFKAGHGRKAAFE